jgi:hypothetical protein
MTDLQKSESELSQSLIIYVFSVLFLVVNAPQAVNITSFRRFSDRRHTENK